MIINPNIEPQTCKNGELSDLENLSGRFIAQEKFDGHRAIMYIKGGKAYFYSRRTSEETGLKEDNTDRLYYLHNNFYPSILDDTILDGELVANWGNTDSATVQTILGSNPDRAKELWENGYTLTFKAFDIIAYRGISFINYGLLRDRLRYLAICKDILYKAGSLDNGFINFAKTYISQNCNPLRVQGLPWDIELPDNGYENLLLDIQMRGGEGIILKDIDSHYKCKRSSDWLKFKAVRTADLVIMGFVEPKKEYTGKFSVEELKERGWDYWENGEPVSKTYANKWVAGIKLGAYKDGKLTYVTTVKGFSDEVQEIIKHDDLSNVVVEVRYQEVINPKTKSLRHPRFNCFRFDKNNEDCLWENL